MTLDEITKALADINDRDGDDESMHVAQDALYVRVLRAIADGVDYPADLAAEALKAQDIEFSRWYA